MRQYRPAKKIWPCDGGAVRQGPCSALHHSMFAAVVMDTFIGCIGALIRSHHFAPINRSCPPSDHAAPARSIDGRIHPAWSRSSLRFHQCAPVRRSETSAGSRSSGPCILLIYSGLSARSAHHAQAAARCAPKARSRRGQVLPFAKDAKRVAFLFELYEGLVK